MKNLFMTQRQYVLLLLALISSMGVVFCANIEGDEGVALVHSFSPELRAEGVPDPGVFSASDRSGEDVPSRPATPNASLLQQKMLSIIQQMMAVLEQDRAAFAAHGLAVSSASSVDEGAEARNLMKLREMLLAQLTLKMKAVMAQMESVAELDEKLVDTRDFALRGAENLKLEFREKLQSMANSLQGQDGNVDLEKLHGVFDETSKVTKDFGDRTDALECAAMFEDQAEFLESLKRELPTMSKRLTEVFSDRQLSPTELAELHAHFEKINKFKKLLGNMTRRLKHSSWFVFFSSSVAGQFAVLAGLTPILVLCAKIITCLAMAISLAFQIYRTYHRAALERSITGDNAQDAIWVVLKDDVISLGQWIRESVPVVNKAVHGFEDAMRRLDQQAASSSDSQRRAISAIIQNPKIQQFIAEEKSREEALSQQSVVKRFTQPARTVGSRQLEAAAMAARMIQNAKSQMKKP